MMRNHILVSIHNKSVFSNNKGFPRRASDLAKDKRSICLNHVRKFSNDQISFVITGIYFWNSIVDSSWGNPWFIIKQ